MNLLIRGLQFRLNKRIIFELYKVYLNYKMIKILNTRTTLQLIILVLLFTYIYKSATITQPIPENVPIVKKKIAQKTIVGAAKDTISEQVAIPSQYMELESLTSGFIKSLDTEYPKWSNVNKLGDIYARGVYPFLQPDDICAIQLYTTCSKCPCPDASAVAMSKNIDSRINPMERSDRRGDIIDPKYAHSVINAANKYIRNAPDSAFKRHNLRPKSKIPPNINPYLTIGIQKKKPPVEVHLEPPPAIERTGEVGGGKQNTHDHGITSATKTNIARLKSEFEESPAVSDSSIVDKMMNICRKICEKSKTDSTVNFNENNLADAHRVIVSLTSDEYSSTGVSQIQILGNVLKKIETLDGNVADGVRETLCKRLASGIERGNIVCGTGKISRCVSVFEGVLENAQKGISIDIVKKEIAQLAAKVRDDYMKKVGPMGRKAYESAVSVPQYVVDMKNIFLEKVHSEYIENLNMTKGVIDPIAKCYSDSY